MLDGKKYVLKTTVIDSPTKRKNLYGKDGRRKAPPIFT